MKRFNNRRILESKNKVVIKQVINFPSKPEMKKLVKATVDDRTKQMIIEAKKRFLNLEKDFAREKKAMEDAARYFSGDFHKTSSHVLELYLVLKVRFRLIERSTRCTKRTLTARRKRRNDLKAN